MVKKICISCNKLKDHYAKGMCEKCYYRILSKRYYSKNKDKELKRSRLWQKNNQDRFRAVAKEYKNNRISKSLCVNCSNPINYSRSVRFCTICLNKHQIYLLKRQDTLSVKQYIRLTRYRLLNILWTIYYLIIKQKVRRLNLKGVELIE